MGDISNKVFENSIKYLLDISEHVPDNNNVLKSYYASKFRILEVRGNMCLPVPKNKMQARCTRCCLTLKELTPSCKVQSVNPSRFAKKMLKKVEKNKVLTRYQEQYVGRIPPTANSNELLVTCSFCKKTVSILMTKPRKTKEPTTNTVVKKKRKQKDRFCGLQKEAVNAAQIQGNKTVNFSKGKQVNIQRENMKKLNNMIKGGTGNQNRNKLKGFLDSCKM